MDFNEFVNIDTQWKKLILERYEIAKGEIRERDVV